MKNNFLKNKSGFTLVELMIVIAIIGILAAVGYPSYLNSVTKANRADAIEALLAEAGRMEVYYLNNNTYTGATVGSATSPEGLYTIAIPAGTDTAFAYSLTATRVPAAADPACTSLSINQLGVKSATGTAPASCW